MEKGKIVFSILTPSYNQGEFIEETIQSVLSQRGDFYIDYIIMDGGSTDQSVTIIKKYEDLLQLNCAAKNIDGRLFYVPRETGFRWNRCSGISYRWISRQDKGQIIAIKQGYHKSFGTIVAWINSDDYYLHEDVFALIVETYLSDQTRLLITGDGSVVNREGKEIWEHAVGRINLQELIYLDYHVLQPVTFFHRSLFDKYEIDPNLKSTFDLDFVIAALVDKVTYFKLQNNIAAFRMYGGNITDNKDLKMRAFRERIRIMKKYAKNKFYLILSVVYQYIFYVVQFKWPSNRFLHNLYDVVAPNYREICYKIIIGENYAERYLIK